MSTLQKHPLGVLAINLLALFAGYYAAIFLHESGHGVSAWLAGVKDSPLDIRYDGWLFMNADEQVDYVGLISHGRGVAAALIGMAGPLVSLLFAVVALFMLKAVRVQRHVFIFAFAYWFLIVNMIPLIQYFSVYPFAQAGDSAEFVHGLNISGWFVFVPGTCVIVYLLRRIFLLEIIRAYVVMPVRTVIGQNFFLLFTLSLMFLIAYMNGYNPFVDDDVNLISRGLAIASIVLVPILFVICNPALPWVKARIARLS